MNTAVICLGANTPDAVARLADALQVLEDFASVTADSGSYPTEPEYTAAGSSYQNRVLVLGTTLSYDDFYARSKQYESAVRAQLAPCHAGLVNLDIDIVVWNGSVVRPLDYASRYFRIGMDRVGCRSSIAHEA